jgi:ketosteroid isomerase-like protein
MKRLWSVVFLVLCVALAAGPAFAQKPKKNDKSAQVQPPPGPAPQTPDDQLIDNAISEMLAGWQINDIDLLRKHYAENVIVVSGSWEPALVGLDKYLEAYKTQRARMQSPSLERSNTFITGTGTTAWVTYQWDFKALVDGQPMYARGHTSLVLEKRNGAWFIVLNHTSLVSQAQEQKAAAPNPPAPKPGNSPSGHRD